jgi:hypothetical protein
MYRRLLRNGYRPNRIDLSMTLSNFFSVAMGIMILSSILYLVSGEAARSVYAIEKINTVNVIPRPVHVTLPNGQPVTVYHLFVVYTQKTDKAYVCQGFPYDPITGEIPQDSNLPMNLPSPYITQGRCIPFESDNRDWPFQNEPSTTLVSGADSKDLYKCFVKITSKFNDAKIPYALLGPNSNSYARAILDGCHVAGGDSRLPPDVLPQLAPGWSITGLTHPFAKLLE